MNFARSVASIAPVSILLALAGTACSASKDSGATDPLETGPIDNGPDGGSDVAQPPKDSDLLLGDTNLLNDAPMGCVGLGCQQHTCPNGGSTTVSGVVYDPAEKNPLYNVVVYVPKDPLPLPPLASGASCDSCDSLYKGHPLVVDLTDAAGKFKIKNMPDGDNIPLVLQIGKWRKQLTIPHVNRCADNALPDKSLSLPKNHTVGDVPEIAISTGEFDTLECLLSRIGLEHAEYVGGASGSGHIHIFHGGSGSYAPNTSPGPSSSSALWDSTAHLKNYDIVLLSCEGNEAKNMNQQALFDYAAAGGRVFASHFHYSWFNTGPFGAANLATWTKGTQDTSDINGNIVTKLASGAPFPKGVALKEWLTNVNGISGNSLPIKDSKHNADVGASNTASQAWIVADGSAPVPGATEYFTFNTPLSAAPDKQCGRVVYSDLHVGSASGDYSGAGSSVTPSGCASADLTPQELALEFMLFDLSSCVIPDSTPPVPPIK